MFLYVFGVAEADFDISFCIVSTILKIFLQQIELCNLPNHNTTLALSDNHITFQSCVISFMTFFYCFHHSLDGTREVN